MTSEENLLLYTTDRQDRQRARAQDIPNFNLTVDLHLNIFDVLVIEG